MRAVCIALLVLLGGCDADTATVVVSVKTDLVPGAEFTGVVVRVGGIERQFVARREQDFIAGIQVAEIGGLEVDANARIDIELVSPEGIVVSRPTIVDLTPLNVGVSVVITRDCVGVVCPGSGDVTATACLAGMCVDPRCSAENPELCLDLAQCAGDSDCAAMDMCSVPVCDDGLCLYDEVVSACGPGFFCVPETGCAAVPDFPDAGAPDAGSGDGGSEDAGPISDAGPADAGAPRCSIPTGMMVTAPPPCSPVQNDMLVDGVIVAEAGGCEVRGRLTVAPEATGFVPLTRRWAGGYLELAADGTFAFIPPSLGLGFQVGIGVELPGGGTTISCLTISSRDTDSMKVLRGPDWNTPGDWDPPGVPTVEPVFVAEGAHTGTSAVVTDLSVSSGATLAMSGTVRALQFFGNLEGDLTLDVGGGSAFSGRVRNLGLGDDAHMMLGATHVTGNLSAVGSAGFLLDWPMGRLTVDGDVLLDTVGMVALMTMSPSSTLDVGGDLRISGLMGDASPEGWFWLRGSSVTLTYTTPPVGNQRMVFTGSGPLQLDASHTPAISLGIGGEVTFGLPTDVTGSMSASRPVTLTSPINVDSLNIAGAFSTTTPALFVCPICMDDSAGARCAALPMCGT